MPRLQIVRILLSLICLGPSFALVQAAPKDRQRPLDSSEARAAAKVVIAYYRARDHFWFEEAKSLQASDLVFVGSDGARRPANADFLSGFMSYEKAMRGHWHCHVLGFREGLLEAEITEENDYYRYLGSGKRIEIERFRVSDGQIHEIIDVSKRYTGFDQDVTYRAFIVWLLQLPESERQGVLRDGKLVFDADGARRQLPLLKRFHAR